jgi:hypothetical protein
LPNYCANWDWQKLLTGKSSTKRRFFGKNVKFYKAVTKNVDICEITAWVCLAEPNTD